MHVSVRESGSWAGTTADGRLRDSPPLPMEQSGVLCVAGPNAAFIDVRGGRGIAVIPRWCSFVLALIMGALLFILGCVCAVTFLANRDCSASGGYGCEVYPVAGIFVLAICVLLILSVASAIVFFSYRDWNSVD
jgi:hypothetical protein